MFDHAAIQSRNPGGSAIGGKALDLDRGRIGAVMGCPGLMDDDMFILHLVASTKARSLKGEHDAFAFPVQAKAPARVLGLAGVWGGPALIQNGRWCVLLPSGSIYTAT